MIAKNISWEEVCERGRLIAQRQNKDRWTLGDLAVQLGEADLDKFAYEIGVVKATLRSYYLTAVAFPPSRRWELQDANPALSWSHFAAARRVNDASRVIGMLEKAQDEGWSAEMLAAEVRKLNGGKGKPKKVVDAPVRVTETWLQHFIGENAHWAMMVTLEFPAGEQGKLQALWDKKVRVVVYEEGDTQ